MQYRRLGRSGVKVSEIALGSWLTYGGSVEKETAIKCIHRAFELGINFFDTANVYRRGAAEEVVGEALRGFARDSYFLATKVYFPMGDGPNDRGLSRKHIMEQCERSLKRLGADYVDLYQCHRYDTESDLEETLRALDDLITQGKVLYAGVSEWSAAQLADGLHLQRQFNLDRFLTDQPRYNMLERYIEKEVIPLCEREGLSQVVYSPLAEGVLTGKYRPDAQAPAGSRATDPRTNWSMKRFMSDEVLGRVQGLNAVAERHGISMAQLSLAWVLRQPNVASAIIGASRPEQVDENIKAVGVTLSEEDLKEIDRILGDAMSWYLEDED